jgi:hypothetical protein
LTACVSVVFIVVMAFSPSGNHHPLVREEVDGILALGLEIAVDQP